MATSAKAENLKYTNVWVATCCQCYLLLGF